MNSGRIPALVMMLLAMAALAGCDSLYTSCTTSNPDPTCPNAKIGTKTDAAVDAPTGGGSATDSSSHEGGSGGTSLPAGDAATSPVDGSADSGSSDCPPGHHSCAGKCVASTSPESCGVSCDPCPNVAGGTTTCDGTRCGISCAGDQKVCKDACVAKDVPCGDSCPVGQNLCNNLCVDAKSLNFCGPSCAPCPTSANGKTSCDGDKCDLICNTGFHRCGDSCLSDNNVQSCGTSCSACPVPTGGTAVCLNGTCDVDCPGGRKCGASQCVASDAPCNGVCVAGLKICNGKCIPPGQCCSGADCAKCQACSNGACANQASGQDQKKECGSDKTCDGAGACKAKDGKPCGSDGDCISGKCGAYWPDSDGDGFGSATAANQQVCGRTAPANFANNNTDCCDSDNSTRPNQTGFFDKANKCGSFDYNCNSCSGYHFANETCGNVADFNVDNLEIECNFATCTKGQLCLDAGEIQAHPCGFTGATHVVCNGDGTGTYVGTARHTIKCR